MGDRDGDQEHGCDKCVRMSSARPVGGRRPDSQNKTRLGGSQTPRFGHKDTDGLNVR